MARSDWLKTVPPAERVLLLAELRTLRARLGTAYSLDNMCDLLYEDAQNVLGQLWRARGFSANAAETLETQYGLSPVARAELAQTLPANACLGHCGSGRGEAGAAIFRLARAAARHAGPANGAQGPRLFPDPAAHCQAVGGRAVCRGAATVCLEALRGGLRPRTTRSAGF